MSNRWSLRKLPLVLQILFPLMSKPLQVRKLETMRMLKKLNLKILFKLKSKFHLKSLLPRTEERDKLPSQLGIVIMLLLLFLLSLKRFHPIMRKPLRVKKRRGGAMPWVMR
ncbi:hypothetical protein ACFX10_015207 [Malus domestica]